jgi:hypothetical protein
VKKYNFQTDFGATSDTGTHFEFNELGFWPHCVYH